MTVVARPSLTRARKVADAVLYEGYVLYPYRASAAKNQVRWQFGVVAPRAFSEAVGSDPWSMQTECLVESVAAPVVDVHLRFLRLQSRTVEAAVDGGGEQFRLVESLEVGEQLWSTWDEAVEEEIEVLDLALDPLDPHWQRAVEVPFAFDASDEIEPLTVSGRAVGRLVRRRESLNGVVRVEADWLDGPSSLLKLRVRVENHTDWCDPAASRDHVVRRSLASAHTMLAVRGGTFVSLMDPPELAAAAAASCENDGTYPVLAGEEVGERNVVLSSPIILYDYPEIAPESPGELCDSTEIDEILALRVLTLTDDEKREARGTDARAAEIVDRIDAMPPEIFERLHGAVRFLGSSPSAPLDVPELRTPVEGLEPEADPPPWWDPGVDAAFNPAEDTHWVGSHEVGSGTRVRLRPRHRSDAHDMFIDGRTATVHAVVHDVDGDVHLGVTIDDDPGAELQQWQRRFTYFKPDEVEVIEP